MPMIDVYAPAGTFAQPEQLTKDLAAALMAIEKVPDIPLFRKNTAAFLHDIPAGHVSNVDGDGDYVRVLVLTNAGALDRDQQLAVVRTFTDLVAAAASDATVAERTWVQLTEAAPNRPRRVLNPTEQGAGRLPQPSWWSTARKQP